MLCVSLTAYLNKNKTLIAYASFLSLSSFYLSFTALELTLLEQGPKRSHSKLRV